MSSGKYASLGLNVLIHEVCCVVMYYRVYLDQIIDYGRFTKDCVSDKPSKQLSENTDVQAIIAHKHHLSNKVGYRLNDLSVEPLMVPWIDFSYILSIVLS